MKKDKDRKFFEWKIEKIIKKGDYQYCIVREHPYATKNGYVLYHRIIMENYLGRLLTPKEQVHHKNGDKHDNRIENLELTIQGEHQAYHGRKHGRKFLKMKCPNCNRIFEREKRNSFLIKKETFSCCSPRCRGQFSRKIQLYGITSEIKNAISENIIEEFKKYSIGNPEENSIKNSIIVL